MVPLIGVFSFSEGKWETSPIGDAARAPLRSRSSSSSPCLSMLTLPLSFQSTPRRAGRGVEGGRPLWGYHNNLARSELMSSAACFTQGRQSVCVCAALTLHHHITKHCLILQRGWNCFPNTLRRDRETKKGRAGQSGNFQDVVLAEDRRHWVKETQEGGVEGGVF